MCVRGVKVRKEARTQPKSPGRVFPQRLPGLILCVGDAIFFILCFGSTDTHPICRSSVRLLGTHEQRMLLCCDTHYILGIDNRVRCYFNGRDPTPYSKSVTKRGSRSIVALIAAPLSIVALYVINRAPRLRSWIFCPG